MAEDIKIGLWVYPLPVHDPLSMTTSVYGRGMVEDYLLEDFGADKPPKRKIRSKGNARGD